MATEIKQKKPVPIVIVPIGILVSDIRDDENKQDVVGIGFFIDKDKPPVTFMVSVDDAHGIIDDIEKVIKKINSSNVKASTV